MRNSQTATGQGRGKATARTILLTSGLPFKKCLTARKASAIMVWSITQEASVSTPCDESSRSIESPHYRWAILSLGSFQSGQMELTVNQLSEDFGGSNPSQ